VIARGAGWVTRTLGGTVLASLPVARVGDGVRIVSAGGIERSGEVAAVERARVVIAPHGPLEGVAVGDRVFGDPEARAFPYGIVALGRVLDAAGRPLDLGPPPATTFPPAVAGRAPAPAERGSIDVPFCTGVRALDGLLTIGRGARVGFFGAPGAGKTTLLETIASGAQGDAVVLALVGERGREAQRWSARVDARTAIVCATADCCAAERVRAADVAMTQAQSLRERGLDVVLIVDSLARFVAALRERRVSYGEPLGRAGFPPAVWADLGRYLERAGATRRGSITLLATVLTDGDDDRDPVAEAARSLLDGHIVLSLALARAGHFPAIDVPASVSRTMAEVVSPDLAADADIVRTALSLLAQTEEARALGFVDGSDTKLAAACRAEQALLDFLRQRGPAPLAETQRALRTLANALRA